MDSSLSRLGAGSLGPAAYGMHGPWHETIAPTCIHGTDASSPALRYDSNFLFLSMVAAAPGMRPLTEAPSMVGTRMVWHSCSISGNGSRVTLAAAAADEPAAVAAAAAAAGAVLSAEAAAMCGRMKGIVKMPRMLVVTVSSSARDTLPPSCCSAGRGGAQPGSTIQSVGIQTVNETA